MLLINRRQAMGLGAAALLLRPAVAQKAATPGDPSEALGQLIDHHRKFKSCFAVKLRTGYCSYSEFDGVATPPDRVNRLLDAASLRLAGLSVQVPTAALLYHARDDGALDVMLLDERGLAGWERRIVDLGAMTEGLRASLNVNERAAARAVVPFGRKRSNAAETVPPASLEAVAAAVLPGEIGRRIVQGRYQRLLVLGSGAVGQLPFPALPLPDGSQIVDRMAVVLLADYEALFFNEFDFAGDLEDVWRTFTFDVAQAMDGAKLFVGNPEFGKIKGWDLPPLPGAEAEISDVGDRLGGGTMLTGKAATVESVKRALAGMQEKGGIAYFATHGVSDPVNPMDGSFLALSKGLMYARDIRKLHMVFQHPLVVMSACQSGLGKTFGGGGFGISRAWYAAGAGQVVGSLWNVSDEGTNFLMSRFAAAIDQMRAPVEMALQFAMLQTRNGFSSDPAIWASFVPFGNPGG